MNFLEYLSNDFIYSFFIIGVVGVLLMVMKVTHQKKNILRQTIY